MSTLTFRCCKCVFGLAWVGKDEQPYSASISLDSIWYGSGMGSTKKQAKQEAGGPLVAECTVAGKPATKHCPVVFTPIPCTVQLKLSWTSCLTEHSRHRKLLRRWQLQHVQRYSGAGEIVCVLLLLPSCSFLQFPVIADVDRSGVAYSSWQILKCCLSR